jgi:hypothetical protein
MFKTKLAINSRMILPRNGRGLGEEGGPNNVYIYMSKCKNDMRKNNRMRVKNLTDIWRLNNTSLSGSLKRS